MRNVSNVWKKKAGRRVMAGKGLILRLPTEETVRKLRAL